jgi:TatD DNase family protein
MRDELFVNRCIDSHAHLTSDELFPQVDQIISRAKKAGIVKVININTDPITLDRALSLQKKYSDFILNTGATTPHDVERDGEKDFPFFEKAARDGELVAIGETGLDYHYEHSNRSVQQQFLLRYLDLASQYNLPTVIHCRGDEAFLDLFSIIKTSNILLHCFTGTTSQAREAIKRGWYISISGIATFKKSTELREVIKHIPIDHLLIETDSPYLAPQSKRGQRNEPAYVEEVARTIAELKELSLKQVCDQTVKNAIDFFDLTNKGVYSGAD